jgi:endonuclease-3
MGAQHPFIRSIHLPQPLITTGDDLKVKALCVHEQLAPVYGASIPFFSTKDPLSKLISALLSHRTRNRDSGAVYKRLRAPFPICVR